MTTNLLGEVSVKTKPLQMNAEDLRVGRRGGRGGGMGEKGGREKRGREMRGTTHKKKVMIWNTSGSRVIFIFFTLVWKLRVSRTVIAMVIKLQRCTCHAHSYCVAMHAHSPVTIGAKISVVS